MNQSSDPWRDYGLPVTIAIGVFSLANFVFNWLITSVPHSIPVYLIGGSLVSLVLLARAFRHRTLTAHDIGLTPGAWKPQYRLLGLVVILFMAVGGFSTLDQNVAGRSGMPASEQLLQEIDRARGPVLQLIDDAEGFQDDKQKAKIKTLVVQQLDDLQSTLTEAPAKDAEQLADAVAAMRLSIYAELRDEYQQIYEQDESKWAELEREIGQKRAVLANATTLVERSLRTKKPTLTDYAFWFAWLLPASISELLVFGMIGFCLPERWLRGRGFSNVSAAVLAAAFAAITFGLYHYTHTSRWWSYAIIPLVPVMVINLTYFIITRNFHLTLLLHNSFAAVGFSGEQLAARNTQPFVDTENFTGWELTLNIVAFAIPFLMLHALEWRLWPRGQDGPQPASSEEKQEDLVGADARS